jgi:hypothetical protein
MDMTVTSGASQMLIDARLDAIDRALLGRVSRPERLNVVGEVEARIHELLADRCGPGVEPARDDVLAVLARLDPPEAYMSQDVDDEAPIAPRVRSQPPAVAGAGEPDRNAWFGAMLGLTSLGMSLLIPIGGYLGKSAESNVPLFTAYSACGVFMLFGGFASLRITIGARARNWWALVGVIAGGLSILLPISAYLVWILNRR